jgi:hypothetical protein
LDEIITHQHHQQQQQLLRELWLWLARPPQQGLSEKTRDD